MEKKIFNWKDFKKNYHECFYDLLKFIYEKDTTLKYSSKRDHLISNNTLKVSNDFKVFHERDIENYLISNKIYIGYGAFHSEDGKLKYYQFIEFNKNKFPSELRAYLERVSKEASGVDCENISEVLSCLFINSFRMMEEKIRFYKSTTSKSEVKKFSKDLEDGTYADFYENKPGRMVGFPFNYNNIKSLPSPSEAVKNLKEIKCPIE